MTNSSGTAITSTSSIANRNPLRYRGYYYDKESGFYYLQSRYYDPEIKRFINADDYASTGQGFIGHNMFAYCNNNPVLYSDTGGNMAREAFQMSLKDGVNGSGGGGIAIVGVSLIPGLWEAFEAIAADLGERIKRVSSGEHKHHIVARRAPAAEPAREKVEEVFIMGVNDPINLIPVKDSIHCVLHTNLYYNTVNLVVLLAYNFGGSTDEEREASVRVAIGVIRVFIENLNQVFP